MQKVSRSILSEALAGRYHHALDGDILDLADYDSPDLRFADPEELEPLFAHPEISGIRHLIVAEGAEYSLAWILERLTTLDTLHLRVTEAYSNVIDKDSFRHIASSPATSHLTSIYLENTEIFGLSHLATSPLRRLKSLNLTGCLHPDSITALIQPAPAFYSLQELHLTPDSLTQEQAYQIGEARNFAQVEALNIPFVMGSGFDWSPHYQNAHLVQNIPLVVEGLQRLPQLKKLRLTSPYDDDELELDPTLVEEVMRRLRADLSVEVAGVLLDQLSVIPERIKRL